MDIPTELESLLAIALGYQRSQALAVAAELGLADILGDGAATVDDLARSTDTDPAALYRLLRALASIEVLHQDDAGRFSLTATGGYLRRDHPQSVDPVVRMFCAGYQWAAWGALGHSVRTGENAAVHALGVDDWEHRRRHPADGVLFDAAMRTLSRRAIEAILAVHDFGGYGTVADVGGGTGALLAAVLTGHPALRGVLVDQPHVVRGAAEVLAAAGVAERVDVVPGDFFTAVPPGAGAYLLRWILHDWSDPDAVRILHRLREAMTPAARLVVVEAVVGPPNTDPDSAFLDLQMLVSAGGRERDEREWRELLTEGGFRFLHATRAMGASHVIVAAPV